MNESGESCENCPVKKNSIFCSLSTTENEAVAKTKLVYQLRKGQNLYTQNTHPYGIYCLKKGNVKLTKTDINGKETIVRLTHPGDILGDESLFSGASSEKTATAINNVEVCFIDRSNALSLIKDNKSISFNLMNQFYKNVNKSEDHLCSFHQKKVSERLAELIIDLKNSNGVVVNKKWKIELKLNREEMAKIIGTSNETLIRSMAKLKVAGVIEEVNRNIFINNENALRSWANNSDGHR